MKSAGCGDGSLNSNSASPPWSALLFGLQGQNWQSRTAAADAAAEPSWRPDALLDRALSQAARHDPLFIAGIAAYRRHPFQRRLSEPPPIWQEGEARLLDYAPGSTDPPVLFVPSLINRGYILDLSEEHSLLRFLARHALRPLLLDWGWPEAQQRHYTLTDYIAGPLERAIAAIGRPVVLAGYCMGGLLATAAALRRPDLVRALAVLATPWDFRAHDPDQADVLARMIGTLRPVLDFSNTVPIDVLQALFALLDPDAVARKYRRFGQLDQGSARARHFVAIEDWANDCVPLAAGVGRTCFEDWYGRNTTLHGQWCVAGRPVAPQDIRVPCFAAIPGADRIVPPRSARPLADLLPGATIVVPQAGHVSMIAGNGADRGLWQAFLHWLQAL